MTDDQCGEAWRRSDLATSGRDVCCFHLSQLSQWWAPPLSPRLLSPPSSPPSWRWPSPSPRQTWGKVPTIYISDLIARSYLSINIIPTSYCLNQPSEPYDIWLVCFVQTIKSEQIDEKIWHFSNIKLPDWRRGRTSDSSQGTNGRRREMRRPRPTSSTDPTATGPTPTPGARRSPWWRWSWRRWPGTGSSRSMSTVTTGNPSDPTSPISARSPRCPSPPISALRSKTWSWSVLSKLSFSQRKLLQNIIWLQKVWSSQRHSWFWLQSLNASQLSYEWPALFQDTVEWVQHPQVSLREGRKTKNMFWWINIFLLSEWSNLSRNAKKYSFLNFSEMWFQLLPLNVH